MPKRATHQMLGLFVLSMMFLSITGCNTSRDVTPQATGLIIETLQNGVRVVIQPVPGTDAVGVHTIYRAGFLNDPEGYPQLAHLVEHLVCKSPTATYQAGEVWKALGELGMVTAETLPTFMHFDYALPARALERILDFEIDRLQSLHLAPAVLEAEARLCYAEVEQARTGNAAALAKWAMTVANQNWRYGVMEGSVLSGLEEYQVEVIARFFRSYFSPQHLTVIIAGDVDGEQALQKVRDRFGKAVPVDSPKEPPVEWPQVAREAEVTWDAGVAAVLVWFEPPVEPDEQMVLSLWGNMISQTLASDLELMLAAGAVVPTSYVWPVGELPFLVYASVAGGYNGSQVARATSDALERIVNRMTDETHAAYIRSYAAQLIARGEMTQEVLESRRNAFVNQGKTPEEATAAALLQQAIDLGIRDMFFRGDVDRYAAGIRALTGARLRDIVRRSISPDRRHVTLLVTGDASGGND